MKLSLPTLLLITLVLSSAFLDFASALSPPAPAPAVPTSLCAKKCDVRCSRNYRKKFCMQLCITCCGKCKSCVPSGPYASKDQCPCYRDMKNNKGKPKCP